MSWKRFLKMFSIVFCAVLAFVRSIFKPIPASAGGSTEVTIYWTDRAESKIHRLRHGQVQDLVAFPIARTPAEIALDMTAGKMYWVDYSTMQINRANLDGSEIETLYVPAPGRSLWGVALDCSGGKMYWTEPSNTNDLGYTIRRANLDGSGVEDLIAIGLIQPNGIALDIPAGKMYWVERSTTLGFVRRANLDGSGMEDLVTGLGAPCGIALDCEAGKMYWTEITGDRIVRANLDGSNVEPLVVRSGTSGEPQNPIGIALNLTQGKMYWTDSDTGKIQRANLDGSSVEDVLTNLRNPIGLAVTVTTKLSR